MPDAATLKGDGHCPPAIRFGAGRIAELAGVRFNTATVGGRSAITAELETGLVARLSRSPDRGDAGVMARISGQDDAGRRAPKPVLSRMFRGLKAKRRPCSGKRPRNP